MAMEVKENTKARKVMTAAVIAYPFECESIPVSKHAAIEPKKRVIVAMMTAACIPKICGGVVKLVPDGTLAALG